MGVNLGGSKGRGKRPPEINITPLVDVVLVLLIIFMVVAPQMQAGVDVKLPGLTNPDSTKKPATQITVTIAKTGQYYFEKEAVSYEELLQRLSAVRASQPGEPVVLKADTEVPYGNVRRLFKACQDLGFPGASLQVGDKSKSQSKTEG
jgi:biopolymer transport protein TolR